MALLAPAVVVSGLVADEGRPGTGARPADGAIMPVAVLWRPASEEAAPQWHCQCSGLARAPAP